MQLPPSKKKKKKQNRKEKANQKLSLIRHVKIQQQPLLRLPLPPLGLVCTTGCVRNTAEKSLSGLDALDSKDFC